jgi:ribosomal RNA-processing protein 8
VRRQRPATGGVCQRGKIGGAFNVNLASALAPEGNSSRAAEFQFHLQAARHVFQNYSTSAMFAVPGWSVSSSTLKTQTSDLSKPQPALPSAPAKPVAELKGKASGKRKRPSEKWTPSEVNPKNLAELWETVIEKKSKENFEAGKPRVPEKQHPAGRRGDGAVSTPANDLNSEDGKAGGLGKRTKYKDNPRKGKAQLQQREDVTSAHTKTTDAPVGPSIEAQLTPLQISMKQKLISSRFRHLNQTLYTTPSAHSLELFRENPEMFEEYHEGFRRQVEIWPENPVDGYVTDIKQRGMKRQGVRNETAITESNVESKNMEVTSLPRTHGICRIADLGCGDARLSQNLDKFKRKLKLEIFNYDLQTTNSLVTKADIANLPLKDGSIDLAIFCLALMGTNWIDFIEEAFRVLRWKGELWIAEIKSRFGRISNKRRGVEHSIGNRKKVNKEAVRKLEDDINDADLLVEVDGLEDNKGETDVSDFVEVLRRRGFILQAQRAVDLSNKMFVKMSFVKGQTPIKGKCVPVPKGMVELGMETWTKKPKARFLDNEVAASSEASVLKPCVYKIR